MEINKYLERINYPGEIKPAIENLSALQEAHLMAVPFENLDIMRGVKIDLNNLYHKIVIHKRGGFCYELNGLFYQLLKQLGFNVKMVSANVYNSDTKKYGADFDHMAIISEFSGSRFLVDVGFGEFALHPLKIELKREAHDPRGIFSMEAFDKGYIVVKKKNAEGKFVPEYIFSETERRLEEFKGMCIYHQTSPESHFTQKSICSLPTRDGRITFTGNVLKMNKNGVITEAELNTQEEKEQALWKYFGVKLDDGKSV